MRLLAWAFVALAGCGTGTSSVTSDGGSETTDGGASHQPSSNDGDDGPAAPTNTDGDSGPATEPQGGTDADTRVTDADAANSVGADAANSVGADAASSVGADAASSVDADAGARRGRASSVGADAGQDGSGPAWDRRRRDSGTHARGPLTAPRQLFASDLQLGAYWETPSGDILTSFRTSITHPQPGIALDDYHYQLQTIVGGTIQPVPNLDVGTCRYQDPPYGSCYVGPDDHGPTRRSLVTDDGKILVVRELPTANSMMHPIVEQLNPTSGVLSPFIELSDIQMHASSLAYNSLLELRQLADGTIALATAMHGDPARTVVFDQTGTRRAQHAGFAFGERWHRFALFLGETSGVYNQRFDWWDPRSGESAFAFGFPPANPAPSFRIRDARR